MTTITKRKLEQDALADYFERFRKNIVGQQQIFESPYGQQQILYADWIASGRLYAPIEERLLHDFGVFVANTHTETNKTGTTMTLAYHKARQIIKKHVNAGDNDCLISYGSGMTGVINKFQRILGLKIPEKRRANFQIPSEFRPIVFVTHMEHHSNQTSWIETICDVEVINATDDGLVNLEHLAELLEKHATRPLKIAAVTACSNVTGITTPYHDIATLMHRAGGLCFVDFACSAPYVQIDMHPPQYPEGYLDAVYFSPHKFLGGPGTTGILIFDARLYTNRVPDNPGGGTVKWTNPWKQHEFIDNIEDREDGGTPPFLQTIKTALCIKLKEEMGIENIVRREHQLVDYCLTELTAIPKVRVFAPQHRDRLGAISFYIEGMHYNLVVKLLNDRFGIQVRGGCSCAGTYGHYLLEVDFQLSQTMTTRISFGDMASKMGWVRLSLHPTMTNDEVAYICAAIEAIAQNSEAWTAHYLYSSHTNEFTHKDFEDTTCDYVHQLFEAPLI